MLLLSPNTFVFSTSNNLKIKICKTAILPAVLHSCETCSLTMRKREPGVFEKRFMGQNLGPTEMRMERVQNFDNEELSP